MNNRPHLVAQTGETLLLRSTEPRFRRWFQTITHASSSMLSVRERKRQKKKSRLCRELSLVISRKWVGWKTRRFNSAKCKRDLHPVVKALYWSAQWNCSRHTWAKTSLKKTFDKDELVRSWSVRKFVMQIADKSHFQAASKRVRREIDHFLFSCVWMLMFAVWSKLRVKSLSHFPAGFTRRSEFLHWPCLLAPESVWPACSRTSARGCPRGCHPACCHRGSSSFFCKTSPCCCCQSLSLQPVSALLPETRVRSWPLPEPWLGCSPLHLEEF